MSGLEGALLRYRILAYTVGTGLLILVFVGIPLTYGPKILIVGQIVGPIHGFLYIIYLLAAVDLARRARFTLLQMAAMIGAGFLPGLAFLIERKATKRVEALGLVNGDDSTAAVHVTPTATAGTAGENRQR